MKYLKTILILSLLTLNLASTPQKEIYISLVEKGQVTQFYNRFAVPEGHVVVTAEPVPNAKSSARVSVVGDLYFYESDKTESNCLSKICWNSKRTHDHEKHLLQSLRDDLIEENLNGLRVSQMRFKQLSNQQLLGSVSKDYLKQSLEAFSATTDRSSAENRKKARDFLRSQYTSMGYSVSEQKFTRGGREGTNLIAEKAGQKPGFFVVSAHYDTVRSPGADDDASGVITGLAVAKALSGVELEYGVKFVAFDLEELGLLGAKGFADFLNEKKQMSELLGLVQLEMTSYDSDNDGAVHIIDCEENTSPELTSVIEKTIVKDGLKLKKVAACTNRSDHAVFWEYGRPAIVMSQNFFGGDGNPCYHRTCDKSDRVNLDYMHEIATSILGAVNSLVSR